MRHIPLKFNKWAYFEIAERGLDIVSCRISGPDMFMWNAHDEDRRQTNSVALYNNNNSGRQTTTTNCCSDTVNRYHRCNSYFMLCSTVMSSASPACHVYLSMIHWCQFHWNDAIFKLTESLWYIWPWPRPPCDLGLLARLDVRGERTLQMSIRSILSADKRTTVLICNLPCKKTYGTDTASTLRWLTFCYWVHLTMSNDRFTWN